MLPLEPLKRAVVNLCILICLPLGLSIGSLIGFVITIAKDGFLVAILIIVVCCVGLLGFRHTLRFWRSGS
jgi:hypothetical protein